MDMQRYPEADTVETLKSSPGISKDKGLINTSFVSDPKHMENALHMDIIHPAAGVVSISRFPWIFHTTLYLSL